MVVKQIWYIHKQNLQFESSVISYGSQTTAWAQAIWHSFESSVISYGSQTYLLAELDNSAFESSVISYGSQTYQKEHALFY